MGKQILLVVEALSNEKGVDKKIVFEAIQYALEQAAKKKYGYDHDIKVYIDNNTGEYKTYRQWIVVSNETFEEKKKLNAENNSALNQVRTYGRKYDTIKDRENANVDKPLGHHLDVDSAKNVFGEGVNIGDVVEQELHSVEFGRISVQIAKQAIAMKIREAHDNKILDDYRLKIGTLITGKIKKIIREGAVIELTDTEGLEAFMPKEEMIPFEVMRINEKVKAYLYRVDGLKAKGYSLFLSRSRPEFLIQLFKIEVPEMAEEILTIKKAARVPGYRAKIAVKTNDGRIDPIGACVGMRGTRVQSVSRELCGERVDIVAWDEDIVKFVISALAPSDILSIVVDEDNHTASVVVKDSDLAQTIGRDGQNVKLASQLTDWRIAVSSKTDADKRAAEEKDSIMSTFMECLDVDEEMSALLFSEGFRKLEELACSDIAELTSIDGIDEEIAAIILDRAKNAVIRKAFTANAKVASVSPVKVASKTVKEVGESEKVSAPLAGKSDKLNNSKTRAFDTDLIPAELEAKLLKAGLKNMQEIADLSTDEFIELVDISEELAAKIILLARKDWFK